MEDGFAALLPPGRDRTWWHWAPLIIALASFLLSYVGFCIAHGRGLAALSESLYSSAQLLIDRKSVV